MSSEYPLLSFIDATEEEGISDNDDWKSLRASLQGLNMPSAFKAGCMLIAADSRQTLPTLPDSSVSCIITSPPYGSLKDYGTPDQIGFGQHREDEYLPDLQRVLTDLYRIAKTGAALWIVMDTMKESGETVPLPWEVITRAREVGWTFQDLVIWDKGKSLPWSSHGRFRGVCEYVLLFGKGKLSHFNLDAVRDSDHLSPYWVKYPERYHPDGKAPSDLWHFPIPTQGSWSKGQSRHFCPFPVGLVARMISITTVPGEIILDPFSGTGTVIAVASYLNRLGVGIELNSDFVNEFDTTGFEALKKRIRTELPRKDRLGGSLRQTIIDLRMLKFSKTLFLEISRGDRLNGKAGEYIGLFLINSSAQTEEDETNPVDAGNLGCIELKILLRQEADAEAVRKIANERTKVSPLSIFGISTIIDVVPFEQWNTENFASEINEGTWSIYRRGSFYKYDTQMSKNTLIKTLISEVNMTRKIPSIISQVQVHLESSENGK